MLFGKTAQEKRDDNLHNAMLVGLKLEDIPVYARNRLLKAAENAGWQEAHFAEYIQVATLAKTARQVRDNMLHEGKVVGLDELDMAMHYLFWLMKCRKTSHFRSTI